MQTVSDKSLVDKPGKEAMHTVSNKSLGDKLGRRLCKL